MFDELTLLDLILKGGYTMIVLAVFSIISLAVILGRAWKFKNFRSELDVCYKDLAAEVGSDGSALEAARAFCEADRSALAEIFLAGFNKRAYGTDEILRAMELSARKSISALEHYVGVLGTIGSTAPFVGLFGTVVGIMRAFSDLANAQGAGPSVVADGIAEALVATAGGLLVAVPAVIAYNYFVRASARIAVDLESAANEFVSHLDSRLENKGEVR
jgi:biopolymer transport protein ExbB/TolQ